MDRKELYDAMANRKTKPKDFQPYQGDNGRVNKCVQLMRSGKIKNRGRLLDVGGGIGDLGFAVRDLFDMTLVIDISQKNLDAAHTKGNAIALQDIDKDGISCLTDENVDVVTALDFIEHIVDPENFARECFRVLKPGGQVFINTPNIRFWRHIEALWHSGRMPHTSGDRDVYHGGHLAFFTFSDLREIFEGVGFHASVQFKDEEGYVEPPVMFTHPFKINNQQDLVNLYIELGCPNLLYGAIKP